MDRMSHLICRERCLCSQITYAVHEIHSLSLHIVLTHCITLYVINLIHTHQINKQITTIQHSFSTINAPNIVVYVYNNINYFRLPNSTELKTTRHQTITMNLSVQRQNGFIEAVIDEKHLNY